jgi:signal transduction histidine kinase
VPTPDPDPADDTRQMDGAWRVWEALAAWDARYAMVVDVAVAAGLFLFCSGWLFQAGPPGPNLAFVAALTAPLMFRRRAPFAVFLVIAAVASVQLVTSTALLADAALLVAMYSVAVTARWNAVIASLGILLSGVIAATVHWAPVESHFESLVFLTGMAFAAFLTGAVVRALRGQIEWLGERAQRLELERDQQASLAAASERARIAREMHDVISHNLQVMVTLADAAGVAVGQNTARASEAMGEVAQTGRQALTDMRRLLGLLRDEAVPAGPGRPDVPVVVDPPQPGLGELEALVERVGATGLAVTLAWAGAPFGLSEAAELTIYRIVQEALTNALRHATRADRVAVTLTYRRPDVGVRVIDNGGGAPAPARAVGGHPDRGHGLPNMVERAAAFGGALSAGPLGGGGWGVETTLHGCGAPALA